MIKKIWIFWHQGWESKKTPILIKKCLKTWKQPNPSWEIIELDKENYRKYVDLESYIEDLEDKDINFTTLSDLIRINLLKKHGGLWVDATTFCNVPLDSSHVGDYHPEVRAQCSRHAEGPELGQLSHGLAVAAQTAPRYGAATSGAVERHDRSG